MRNKNAVTLSEALDMMVKQLKRICRMDEVRIREGWQKIMGNPIAKYTDSLNLKAGKLYIKVNSAPLKNELQDSRDKIKELFNKELGGDVINEVVIF